MANKGRTAEVLEIGAQRLGPLELLRLGVRAVALLRDGQAWTESNSETSDDLITTLQQN